MYNETGVVLYQKGKRRFFKYLTSCTCFTSIICLLFGLAKVMQDLKSTLINTTRWNVKYDVFEKCCINCTLVAAYFSVN